MHIDTITTIEEYGYNFEREHQISVSVKRDRIIEDGEERSTYPRDGQVVYFSVYTVQRLYGGPEEGGWWYNWSNLEYSIPFRYNHGDQSQIHLMIEAERDRIADYVYGDIYSVRGGQDCYVLIESKAGGDADTERPYYE